MFPLLLALTLPAQPPAGPDAANPLYRDLRETGLLVGTDLRAKLPAPILADGLDAAGQQAALRKFIGTDYSWEEFTRQSAVAPQLLRIRDVTPSDPKAPARAVDVGFVAYGDLKAADDEKFLDKLLNTGRGGGAGKALTAADLAKRKIVLTAEEAKRESYGSIEFEFLEKVRLRATGRAVWSRNADSVVVAAQIDPRFTGDAEFPNEWKPFVKGGGIPAGLAQPYQGAGFYLKITRLAEPTGALFVEQHTVFAEPAGWFDGANLLRSKLPPVVQNNVRSMRREWAKASGK